MFVAKFPALALAGALSLAAQNISPADFFETKIRPVLANSCNACHNPKLKSGGLDLSSAAGFREGGKSGPIVSKDQPESSRLLQALRYDGAIKMPPMGKLPDQQIAEFDAWVKIGAVWPETGPGVAAVGKFTPEQRGFWSFQPVKDHPVPLVKNSVWPKSPIDNFILAKLEEKKLAPAPAADKLTLLRRATFDLTGLPPTAKEIDDFLNDRSPNAFAKVVDRLLDSPRYGERWGRHWLDVARYADSTGADEDIRYPYAWRYRDYVIDAFNRDLPYNQFVREQLAGDLLPAEKSGEVNRRGIVATGFLAIGLKLLAEQDKPKMVYDMVDEQLDATTRAFLGLTVACARCHDHKFDPIPTKDYYSLASIFASTKSLSKVEGTVSQIYFAPLVPSDVYARYEQHKESIQDRDRQIDQVVTAEATDYLARLAPRLADYMIATFDYERRPSNQEGVCIADFALKRKLDALALERWIEYLRPSSDVRPHLDRWNRAAAQGTTAIGEAAASYQKDFEKRLADWRPKVDEWGREVADAAAQQKHIPEKPQFEAGLDRFFSEIALEKAGPFTLPQTAEDTFFVAASREKLHQLRASREELKKNAPPEPEMACGVAEGVNVEQHVLVRGTPSNPGDLVPKQFLQIIAGEHQTPITHGSGRLELANWLTDPAHPLTARVMVNRIWQYHFGEGLVRTPNNFGKLGEQPSHPELLDYLAKRFVEGGWSVKKMHRLVMLSSAYQMNSRITKQHMEADPSNRLLSRFNRRRLDVEEIRDGLLAIDGSIDLTMGGTLQSGFGTDGENSEERLSINPSTSKRRTVYLPLRRSNLPTLLNLFDFGDATTPGEGRAATNVAPQALFMMNSRFIADRSRELARKLEAAAPDDRHRIINAYVWMLGRKPSDDEIDDTLSYMRGYASKAAQAANVDWNARQSLCRTLISSNEFIYVD